MSRKINRGVLVDIKDVLNWENMKDPRLVELDSRLIDLFAKNFQSLARLAVVVVYFWFGFVKLAGLSPAGPLAEALALKTVGMEYFEVLFYSLAVVECLIGVLFLIPRATRTALSLLFIHMLIVCSPLILLPDYTWQQFGVPTLEGQYIIKNVTIIALSAGLTAALRPLGLTKAASQTR
jgi:uncharacterized membrane protein YkgB